MCRGLARPIDRHPFELVNVDDQQLQVVNILCYLVDTICASSGLSASITTRCRTAWRKFRDTLPLLMNRGISLDIRESIYTSYKCGATLYGRMQVLGDEERRACKVQKKRAPLC